MKKFVSLLLSLVFVFTLGGCAETYSDERIKEIKQEAYDKGYAAGYDAGYEKARENSVWLNGDRVAEIGDSVEPIQQAMSRVEAYLFEEEDSVDLVEVYDLLFEGLNDLYQVLREHG